jgi:MSHA pilin protein MshC
MCRKSSDAVKRAAGFTMVELITIMIILGILAAVAIPRMTGTNEFRAVEFHDRTVAALRFAQKAAVSHRRMVCVAFSATTVTLTIDHDRSGDCNNRALNLPGSNTHVLTSSDTTNAVFNPVPAGFNFLPNGTGADRTLEIAGQPNISVAGATGYVN